MSGFPGPPPEPWFRNSRVDPAWSPDAARTPAPDEEPVAALEDLTDEERKAIMALSRLGGRWPQSLQLFSWSGRLCVVRNDGSLHEADDPEGAVICAIRGIPNDGGDPQGGEVRFVAVMRLPGCPPPAILLAETVEQLESQLAEQSEGG